MRYSREERKATIDAAFRVVSIMALLISLYLLSYVKVLAEAVTGR